MRRILRMTIVCFLAAASFGGARQTVQTEPLIVSELPIDLAALPSEEMVRSALLVISQLTGTAVGFEETTLPTVQKRLQKSVDLRGMTLRSALDTLVREDPRYQWREMSGVIVVRPADSWNNCSHFLHRRISVGPSDLTIKSALAMLFALIDPSVEKMRTVTAPSHGDTFFFRIQSRPMVEVLNEMARRYKISWHISSTTAGDHKKVTMSITLRAADGYREGLSMEVSPVPAACPE